MRRLVDPARGGDRLGRRRAGCCRTGTAPGAGSPQVMPARLPAGARGPPGRRATRAWTRTAARSGRGSWRPPWLTPRGFLTDRERELPDAPAGRRCGSWTGTRSTRPRTASSCAGRPAAAWTAASRSATSGCPLGNLIPEWNDLTWRDDWAGRDRAAARDQQLPGVHRAAVPGAVRDRLRARHQPAGRDHQAGRGRDHRAGLASTATCVPRPPDRLTRQDGRRRRLRPGRAGRRPAADPGRPHRRRLRAGRPDRRPAALRHPRVQDGEGGAGPPAGPDGGRGHAVPRRRRRRRRPHRQAAARPLRRGRARRSARPSPRDLPVPGRELGGDPAGDGVPAAVQPGLAGRAGRRARSPPRASTSSSSAAATPARTASARRIRQGAASVTQLEILPRPPEERPAGQPWPTYPMIFRVSSAHEEGGERVYARQHPGVRR